MAASVPRNNLSSGKVVTKPIALSLADSSASATASLASSYPQETNNKIDKTNSPTYTFTEHKRIDAQLAPINLI